MSMTPHYMMGRSGTKFGNIQMLDGITKDGLLDVYNKVPMGNCAELCAKNTILPAKTKTILPLNPIKELRQLGIGKFADEVVPVSVPQRKGDPKIVDQDEEFKNVFRKIPNLRPAFDKEGTITAANASTLNDGASCLILASEEAVKKNGLTPIAKIVSYADAAHEPEWFTTAPSKAVRALSKANLETSDIDFWELNQAFSVVGIANTKLLGLDSSKVDVNGGAGFRSPIG